MGITATGLRYPEPGDPLTEGAQNIHDLADDVTARYQRVAGGMANATANTAGTVIVVHNLNRRLTAVVVTETNNPAMANKYVRPNGDFSNPNQFACSVLNAAGVGVGSAAVQFLWIGV